jgi:hypothetical protein
MGDKTAEGSGMAAAANTPGGLSPDREEAVSTTPDEASFLSSHPAVTIYPETLKRKLESLSELPPAKIQIKLDCTLEESNPLFHFLRSFVPFYYKMFMALKVDFIKILGQDTCDCQGICVGDAHPENFGFILNKFSVPVFTLNDVDDGGYGYIAADALRFFTACLIGAPDTDLEDIIKAYRQGVAARNDQAPRSCKYLEDLKGKIAGMFSEDGRPLPELQKINFEGRHIHAVDRKKIKSPLRKAVVDCEPAVVEALKEFVTSEYELTSLNPEDTFDAAEELRPGGGSGGLQRFLAVAREERRQQNADILLIEFKELTSPGVYPMLLEKRGLAWAETKFAGLEERIQQLFRFEVIGGYHQWYKILNAGDASPFDKPFLMRPRFGALIGIELEEVMKKHSSTMLDVLTYEAFTLGQLHRYSQIGAADRGLNKAWVHCVTGTSTESWEKAAELMVTRFRQETGLY